MQNAMRFVGKTALITGAAHGIGKAAALRLAWEGAKVGILDLNLQGAQAVAEEIRAAGGEARAARADIRESAQIEAALSELSAVLGEADVLVNNAGGIVSDLTGGRLSNDLLENTTEESIRLVLDVNLLGPFLVTRQVIPGMLQKGKGKIVNIASVAGVNGIPRFSSYSAAKGGVIAFTHTLAMELGKRGINVNCISPGSILTHGGSPETFLGRVGQPEEVANLIAFLASEESDFITGRNYIIDGGRCLSMKCYDVV